MLIELARVGVFTLWKLGNTMNQAFIYFFPGDPVVKHLTAATPTCSFSRILVIALAWGLPSGRHFKKRANSLSIAPFFQLSTLPIYDYL